MNKVDFETSYQRIREFISPSPLIRSNWLSDELDAEVYLKLECLQPGNSFKIRGATNALLDGELPKKVVTASGGNHGLGVAIACHEQGVPCHVVLPKSTSPHRVSILKKWNAEVELHGDAWDEANTYALDLAKEQGVKYIHPFADIPVILGQGTIAMELMEELDEIEVLIASVGGGGLLTGIAMAMDAFDRKPILVAVETEGADSFSQSFHRGEIVELPAITSIAKTLGAKKTVPFIFDNLSRLVDHSLTVSDSATVEALLEFLDKEKILIEPASACCIAAMRKNPDICRGRKVVFIICGSNVLMEEVKQWKESFSL